MTVGFALATGRKDAGPAVCIVADSRLSAQKEALSDVGIKTYELGGQAGMVAAGSALPAITAADIVRPIVSAHNRESQKPMGFYDIARLTAFFLKKACEGTDWSCQTVVAGFLQNGSPCLATVTVSDDENTVRFESAKAEDTVIMAVGTPDAKEYLMQGLAAAKAEDRLIVGAGLSLIRYMSRHPAFPTVGGGISVGTCQREGEGFSWPQVEIENQRFLRGLDITPFVRPSWPAPEVVEYDEAWCEQLDRRLNQERDPVTVPIVAAGGSYEIDTLCTPETLFQTRDDPPAFTGGIAEKSG
jgi:hypothetical protein